MKILKSNLELMSKQDANSGLRRDAFIGRKKHQKHTHIRPSIVVQIFHCWYINIYFCITIPTYAYHYFLLFYFSPAVPCLSLSLSLKALSCWAWAFESKDQCLHGGSEIGQWLKGGSLSHSDLRVPLSNRHRHGFVMNLVHLRLGFNDFRVCLWWCWVFIC